MILQCPLIISTGRIESQSVSHSFHTAKQGWEQQGDKTCPGVHRYEEAVKYQCCSTKPW